MTREEVLLADLAEAHALLAGTVDFLLEHPDAHPGECPGYPERNNGPIGPCDCGRDDLLARLTDYLDGKGVPYDA